MIEVFWISIDYVTYDKDGVMSHHKSYQGENFENMIKWYFY